MPPAEQPVEPEIVEETPEFGTADADEVLAYRFVAGIVEDMREEELPETRAELEGESEDLYRLAETLRTPFFSSVPRVLLVRARGVIAKRQALLSDALHERRFEPADEQGEEVAPGLFETADGRLVDEDGNEYREVGGDVTALGPLLEDGAGNRYVLDEVEGLIPLPAPERDEQGRESAATQHENESEEAEREGSAG